MEDHPRPTTIRPSRSWLDPERHLLAALAHPWYRAIAELQDCVTQTTTRFFASRGLRTLHLPLTTQSISSPMGLGSDSLPVKIHLAGKETYLADSMQFLLEYGCRLFRGGCWYLMPSFRGEERDERHLTQFFHAEAEIHGGLGDVLELAESYLRELSRTLIEACGGTLDRITGDHEHVECLADPSNRIRRVRMAEAIGLVGTDPALVREVAPGAWTLTPLGERRLLDEVRGPVWVTHFNHLAVPFYQAFDGGGQVTALNADLLLGAGEVMGAGERHSDESDLAKALALHGVRPDDYRWYAEMKKAYPLQTSGFGLGIERFLLWVLRHNDIRDCQIVPRDNSVIYAP